MTCKEFFKFFSIEPAISLIFPVVPLRQLKYPPTPFVDLSKYFLRSCEQFDVIQG